MVDDLSYYRANNTNPECLYIYLRIVDDVSNEKATVESVTSHNLFYKNLISIPWRLLTYIEL